MTNEKKVSLQDAIKQKLEAKKQGNASNQSSTGLVKQTKKMNSQLTKKPSNTRRKMGV